MKKYLLLLTILLLTFKFGISQTNIYHPMPNSNAIWRVDRQSGVYCWPPSLYSKYQYTIGMDTTIGIKTYKKIYNSGTSPMCGGSAGNYFYNYAGGMRQDTINKKVYFICPNYSTDTLLYDFSLHIGDTLHTAYISQNHPYGYFTNTKITSIDSVLVGNNYHKRFNLNYNFSFIEGVGGSSGLLEPLEVPNDDTYSLTCFTYNTTMYPSTSSSCPLITGGIDEQNAVDDFHFQIYPNPFSSQATLHTDKIFKNAILTVCSSFGQQVKQIKNISGQTITLHRDNLSSGLYFIRLTQDGETLTTEKLIITD